MSTVPRPPWRLLVSIQPRAMPAPTRAMTWQWVVEVGIPRKVQPITTSEADTTTMKVFRNIALSWICTIP